MALFTHYPASILLPSGPLFSYCSWGSQGRNTEAVCHSLLQWHYFANKGLSSQGYGFSSGHVWMWESWTVKKAERWRIDAFELWCWWGLLRVPWTARRSNQSILKEISPKYSLEVLMLKLKLQYFDYMMGRIDSFEGPDACKDWRQKEKGTTEDEMIGWHPWLDRHEFEQALGVGVGQGSLACCSSWVTKSRTRLNEWPPPPPPPVDLS